MFARLAPPLGIVNRLFSLSCLAVSVASAAPQPARGRITGRRDSKKAACPLLQVPSILQELLSHVIALDEIAYLALLDIRRSRSTSSFF